MKSFKSFITVIVILSAAALILTACGGSSGGGNVTLSSIAVMPANPSIVVGASQQFTATGTYSDSSTQNITTSVTWSSSNTGVSTINTSGLAASVAAGTTTITAISGSISGSTTFTVTGVVSLPQTGQTTPYGTDDDGTLKKGVAWPSPRFMDNANGTVTDNLTGLIWLKNANCFSARTWTQALSDANNLASGQCSLTDGSSAGNWRLPNRKELRSLINYGQTNSATWLNPSYFSNVQASGYWLSTTYAINTSYAWFVRMDSGYVGFNDKSSNYYVWPVRAGQ